MISTAIETVYISGPMKGMPDGNREAFAAAERFLQSRGYATINPHDLSPERIPGETDAAFHARCLKIDLAVMENRAHAIYLLLGWEASNGALEEFGKARELKLRIMHE